MSYSFLFNPFAKLFSSIESPEVTYNNDQFLDNSLATSEDDLIAKQQNRVSYGTGDIYRNYISFDAVFATKKEKIITLTTLQ